MTRKPFMTRAEVRMAAQHIEALEGAEEMLDFIHQGDARGAETFEIALLWDDQGSMRTGPAVSRAVAIAIFEDLMERARIELIAAGVSPH